MLLLTACFKIRPSPLCSCTIIQPEPSALEKKLLRKRQRQELKDAIAGEVDTHGIADNDKDGEGDSKTASFKGKQRGRQKIAQQAVESAKDIAEDVVETSVAAVEVLGETAKVVESSSTIAGGDKQRGDNDDGDVEGQGEKQGRKRKARRKKGKAGAAEIAEEVKVALEMPPPATAAQDQQPQTKESVEGENAQEQEPGAKKQRRGWGKARSQQSTPSETDRGDPANGEADRESHSRNFRKKTRSKQKNIRKDKRPMDQRPAHVRAGDPEFSGRGLTEETRTFLGLPATEDSSNAPPAGWGKPGKMADPPGWVIDTKPGLATHNLSVDGEGGGKVDSADSGKAVEMKKHKKAKVARSYLPSGKSKYKNITLPSGRKTKKNTKR